jgi:RNA ligase (TIGR02306 family)
MRKLASIRTIDELTPIDDADTIECATVGGWRTVVKKGEFKVGQLAVYFEIDSWIPKTVAPFLCKGKTYEGIEGARLKTVRLRGQLSQGLLLPLQGLIDPLALEFGATSLTDGFDLTEDLGIKLWEPPPPKQQGFTGGKPKGNFPAFLRKTDQERIQNLKRELQRWQGERWEITEKLDGTSFTAYRHNGEVGVCSRNFELKADEAIGCFPGLYWQVANDLQLLDLIPDGYAVQGEIIGPGIQGNKYKLDRPQLFVFDVFSIAEQRYLAPEHRRLWCAVRGLQHVPVLGPDAITPPSIDEVVAFAEGKSQLADVEREGLVFKHVSQPLSYKAISNAWLLAEK